MAKSPGGCITPLQTGGRPEAFTRRPQDFHLTLDATRWPAVTPLRVMQIKVTASAQPLDQQRLLVIRMMHFGVNGAATGARFWLKRSAAFSHFGSGSRAAAALRFSGEGVFLTPLAHVRRMARSAVALILAAVRAAAA